MAETADKAASKPHETKDRVLDAVYWAKRAADMLSLFADGVGGRDRALDALFVSNKLREALFASTW